MNDLKKLFRLQKKGLRDLWSVDLLIYAMTKKKKTIYPSISFIKNIGLDGSGENCRKRYSFNGKEINKIIDTPIFNFKLLKHDQSKLECMFNKYYQHGIFKRTILSFYDFFRWK